MSSWERGLLESRRERGEESLLKRLCELRSLCESHHFLGEAQLLILTLWAKLQISSDY